MCALVYVTEYLTFNGKLENASAWASEAKLLKNIACYNFNMRVHQKSPVMDTG